MTKNSRKPLWYFPWGYAESFIFISGLLLTGYLLQVLLGNVKIVAFPGNLIALLSCIALICILYFTGKNTNLLRWLRSVPLSIAAISMLLLQGIIMGVMPQHNTPQPHDIFGFTSVLLSWPFILTNLVLLFNLGFVILHRTFPFKKKNITFLANHLGLWIVLAAGTLGAGDLQRYEMHLNEGETVWMGTAGKKTIEMPFAIQLNNFSIEEYTPKLTLANTNSNEIIIKEKNALKEITEGDEFILKGYRIKILKYYSDARSIANRYEPVKDYGAVPAAFIQCSADGKKDTTGWISCGSFLSAPSLVHVNDSIAVVMMEPEPKSFRSYVRIYTPDEKAKEAVIEVNKPLSIKGWKVYQISYDAQMGKYSTKSTLEVIRDPWLPVVYAGVFMMILGAVLLIFRKKSAL